MSALSESLRYRSLVDRLGAIVWEAIPGTRPGEATFTFVSEGTETLLGYPAERWLADPRFWFEIIHPDDRDRVNGEIAGAARAGRGADFEYRARAAGGREVWLRNIVQPDAGEDGFRLTGVLIDITERRAADQRLRRLHELTDALSGILTAREVAAVVAARGRAAVGATAVAVFLRVGDELELCGYDGYPEEAIQEYCSVPIGHDVPTAEVARTGEEIILDSAELQARYPGLRTWRKLAGYGRFVTLPLSSGDRVLGSVALRLADDRPVGTADRVVLDVLVRSCVSALLRAEQSDAERDARAMLDTIITTAPEGFALFDTDLRYVRVNDRMAEINGIPAAEHPGRTLAEIVPDVAHADPLRHVLATGEPVVDLEVTGRTAGAPHDDRTWLGSYYPIRGAAGEIAWLGCFIVDITARKRAEARALLLGDLGSILDEVVSVEARMRRLVDTLVPELCSVCSISLRGPGGALERMAFRGTTEPQISVPLLVRGRDIGVLALTLGSEAADTGQDESFAEEVARRAALAVDNARLYEGERVARERTARQYAVAAGLAEALTAADVAAATLAEIIPAVGADHGTVWQVTEDGTGVEAIGWSGFTSEEMAGDRRVSLSDHRPVADSIRARRMLSFASSEELEAAYPALAPGLRERNLRSAAVFPLLTAGRAVGGLFLSSSREHAMGPEDLALGMALAAQAAQALERARLFEAERRVSVTLQRSLLPDALPRVPGVEIDLRYLPAAGLEAGGDFYEALTLPDGSLVVAVGDVVGRGATAAAAMGQLRSALRGFALIGDDPSTILRRLSAFADTVPDAMAATAVVAKLDPESGRLRYACAGHPWPLLVLPQATAEFLHEGRGVPLGCLPDPEYPQAELDLEPGATLLFYTDGLTERRGQDIDLVLDRLRSATARCAVRPLGRLLDSAVAGAGDAAPADDVALIALRFTAAGSAHRRLVLDGVLDQIPVARAAVREWLAPMGLDAMTAADILLASGEAIANAIEHSGTNRVGLELAVVAGGLSIVVRDHGTWKDPTPTVDRGRGFGLMRALMDECDVQRGPEGTIVRLRHRLDPARMPVPAVAAGPAACEVAVQDGTALLRGDLDLACATEVRGALATAGCHTVDLTGVTYLDSTGARMLLDLASELLAPATIIAPTGGAPRRALELSGLIDVLDVRPPA